MAVLGVVSIEGIPRFKIPTESSHNPLGIASVLDNHFVEGFGRKLHVVVQVQDPVVSGNLTKVEPQTQSHFVVVLDGINIFDLVVYEFKCRLFVGMQEQNFVNVGMRQKGSHHGTVLDHSGSGKVHENHRYLFFGKRKWDGMGDSDSPYRRCDHVGDAPGFGRCGIQYGGRRPKAVCGHQRHG